MEVILLKEIKRLGRAGEVKRVADGYARNYLLPRGLAVLASDQARQNLVQRAEAEIRRAEAAKSAAQTQAQTIDHVELVFVARVGDSGRLYGSITNADIAKELTEKLGQEVDKRKVLLETPIKEKGKYKVEVRLSADIRSVITVIVQPET